MPGASTTLLELVEKSQLLNAPQREEVRQVLQRKFPQPEALTQELLRRGWLTPFQAKLLAQGRGGQLLLGPYLLLEPLGEGASGQVFKARHQKLGRLTALKVLRRDLAQDSAAVDRFYREIEVASHVSHPHLVHAYEAGPIGNDLILAMEYVEGIDLDRLVQRHGPLPPDLACEYIRQAADGLQHAHERGLVHRDIKPSNLLVSGGGVSGGAVSEKNRSDDSTLHATLTAQHSTAHQIKILDLGLARLHRYTAGSKTSNLTILDGNSVMQGTPDYMSPEQALDFHGADIRADIYSLGCTLYFLLAGHPPFPSGKLAEKLMRHQQTEPNWEAIRQPLPKALLDVLRKMLAKRPPDRYQTPGEVAAALRPCCGNPIGGTAKARTQVAAGAPRTQVVRKRRWPLLLGGLAGLMVLCAGLGALLLPGGSSPEEVKLSGRVTPTTTIALSGSTAPVVTQPGSAAPAWIAGYRGHFQVPKPSVGWQYLWNAKGVIGRPASYSPLLPAGLSYNMDGMGGLPRPEPGSHVYLSRDLGHPGRGVNQAAGFDRYAIAAFTLQERHGAGDYCLAQSSISGGNGLHVVVHVNDQPPALSLNVPKSAATTAFNADLGRLRPGDTIYVGVGPAGNDGQDTFSNFDYAIARAALAQLNPRRQVVFGTGFEDGWEGWTNRGEAERGLDAVQPHQGKQAFRIATPAGAPLQYQQIWRYVDEEALPGNRYRATVWVRTQGVASTESGAYGYLEFLSGQVRTDLKHTKVNPKNGVNGWEQLAVEAVVPAGTKQVRFGLVLQAHGTAWFDDVEVVREAIFQPGP